MPVDYTNRKGQTYTLYRGQTKTGKPRYYFGRVGNQSQGELVAKLPEGFVVSESVNGVVSLVKDRSPLILPEEVAAVEGEMQKHPEALKYRVATKHDHIEIYEQIGPNFDTLLAVLHPTSQWEPGLAERLKFVEERHAQYMPVLRFTLFEPRGRWFGVKRMCYRGSIDGWLELGQIGPITELAPVLIPTLGTDQFFELW